jgi:denticleless
LHTLGGGLATIKSVAWQPAGETVLATGGRDGRILVWDLRTSHVRGAPQPVLTFALDKADEKALKLKGKKAKLGSAPSRSITGLLWAQGDNYSLTSSGSLDGILRRWDFRLPSNTSVRASNPTTTKSELDPTTQHGSLRPRGLTSLTAGHGPTAGLLFALGADARVHAYHASTLNPLPPASALTHEGLQGTSFYVRSALSPCGSWLATGCAGPSGSAFLFDVSGVASAAARGLTAADVRSRVEGVRICAQKGEVGAVDWGHDGIATCADDGTVRMWRPDMASHRRCEAEPEEATWDWAWAV